MKGSQSSLRFSLVSSYWVKISKSAFLPENVFQSTLLLQATRDRPQPKNLLKFFQILGSKLLEYHEIWCIFRENSGKIHKHVLSNRWYLNLKSCFNFQGPLYPKFFLVACEKSVTNFQTPYSVIFSDPSSKISYPLEFAPNDNPVE